ncbi:hypothetical protein K7640_10160 [Micromonospora sp. PLK6-60]|uniref:hypothetical protein n=1 Tax=Micromonospora sp. PLK6-60 TaxID=2873383 RepID=UPI001CA769CC|nr:hypothetical protein [Micromonospora sp. PLK6-60]MBY8872203.1 hypothetical protein [Micromonospora sp. PLK6-60]
MSDSPGLVLPSYFSHFKWPLKLVATEDGGMRAWRLARGGGWESADDAIDEVIFAMGGEVKVLTPDRFVQLAEWHRARHLRGEGPVFALYETIKAIEETAESDGRGLTDKERAIVAGLRRRTFVMFEEELRRRGDPGADPSVAV